MSFPRYPEYKDSSVEWLGEVPVHWEVVKLGYLAISQGGGTPPKDELQYWNGNIPWVTPKDMKQQWITSTIDTLSEAALHASPVNMIDPGHVLIVFRSGILRHRIPVAINKAPVTVNQDIRAYNVRPRLLPDFFLRLTQGLNRELLPEWSKQGATVESLDSELVSSTHLPVPSREEQEAITAFLDHETARIDALVEEQQRLIELLKEKRQAVISHAVTKGLDPDVPMKDSGVEWLGEVPAHWDVKSLMHLTPPDRKIMYGIVLPGPDFDGGVPIIKGGDVKPGRLSLDKLCRTDPKIEEKYERSRVDCGDIVYSIRGGIGDAEIVPKEIAGSNLTQDAARVAPRDGVFNIWLLYALKSGPVFAQLEAKATGATIRGINIMDLKRAAIPVPPLQEQQQIAERLVFVIGKLDRLEKEAGSAITLMQEHRSALISAAVTGKIDVRGWQPPAGSSATSEHTQTELV